MSDSSRYETASEIPRWQWLWRLPLALVFALLFLAAAALADLASACTDVSTSAPTEVNK